MYASKSIKYELIISLKNNLQSRRERHPGDIDENIDPQRAKLLRSFFVWEQRGSNRFYRPKAFPEGRNARRGINRRRTVNI